MTAADLGADPVFDHITALACDVAGLEMAALILVEADGLSLRSCVGLEPGGIQLIRQGVSGRGSLWQESLLSPEPLVVADTSADPRFADDALVAGGLRLRVFAGCPLISPAGEVLGCLAAFGRAARHVSPRQLRSLQRLAALGAHHAGPPWSAAGSGSSPATRPSPAALLSRRQILADLEDRVQRAAAEPFAVVRCRLRDHERIRATFGEALAEACLVEACLRLLPALPAGARVGRLAAEELLLLWPRLHALEQLEVLGQQLTGRLGGLHRIEEVSVSSAMDLGIVASRSEEESGASLLADAALALQRAGRAGGSSWHCLDAETRGGAVESFRFASQFHAALVGRDLRPVFQPIVDLATGSPQGFEALVRWDHQGQVLPPSRFMPQARDAGVTGEVDLLMVEKTLACLPQLAQAWQQGTAADRPRRSAPASTMLVSLNLSGCMLDDPALRQRLLELLGHATVPEGWRLQVEVLEEAFSHGSAAFDRFLRRLCALEVSLAIDDFGTGYSSLARLVSLPIQRVKLDRGFIAPLDSGDPAPRTLLSRMAILLRDLDLAITAEGVDSEVQRTWLLEHGITSAQGYLFAPPLPLDEALRYLRQSGTGGRVLGLPLRMA